MLLDLATFNSIAVATAIKPSLVNGVKRAARASWLYAGQDRQELLRQIAFDEPKLLRKWDRAIPAELETIVLKATEKNPHDRYATARELADDLDRWLRDEPIRARRPSLIQRLRQWTRRHRAWAQAAATYPASAPVARARRTTCSAPWRTTGCVRRASGDWTQIQARHAGELHVVIRFSLTRVFEHGPRCS